MFNKSIIAITENLLSLLRRLRNSIGSIFEPFRITPVAYVAGTTQEADWSAVTMLQISDLSVLNYQVFAPGDVIRLALSPDRASLWVSDPRGHKIHVLNANTLDILGEPIDLNLIRPDYRPMDIVARQSDEPEAWVVCRKEERRSEEDYHEILVYNMNDRSLLRTISIGINNPNAITLTPDNRKAYVLSMTPPQVAVIDCAMGRQTRHIQIDPDPERPTVAGQLQEAVVHPDSHDVYITNRTVGRIERIVEDTAESAINTDPYPRAIGISPDGNYLFVGHGTSEADEGVERVGRVNMLRLSDYDVVSSAIIDDPGSNPRTIAVSSRGDQIVVPDHRDSGSVYIFEVDYGRESLSEVAHVDLREELGHDILPVEVVLGSVVSGGILWRLFRG